ncbi:MAG: histidine phosphatase family protein [Gammaproteobacteria bacterium]|nr:histidine phosphatase family protein [Gammaproteobacteria bacterium]
MPACIAALVRHGDYHQLADVPSAQQPFALTGEGRAQAQRGAAELMQIIIAHGWSMCPDIDSSNMLRAWQTAQIFAGVCGAKSVASFDSLAERGLGCAANLTFTQIENILHDDPRYPSPPLNWKADSHYRLPLQGAESLVEAGRRVADHIERRMAELAGGDGDGDGNGEVAVFVGHGAAFRHAAFHLGALELDRVVALSMYHDRPVFLEFDTDGRWRHVAGDWKLRTKGSQD